MKQIILMNSCLAVLFIFSHAFTAIVMADDAAARQIMQQVEDRDDGDHMTSDLLMVLVDKNGSKRKKWFQTFSKDFGMDEKRIMFIKDPPDIRNTGFLTHDYDDPHRDDDQWLFLPALGKTKRIASQDKSSSFMGSDLNYSDMTQRNTEDYDYKLLKETTINTHKVWLIESVPKTRDIEDENGYKKSVLAVRQDNFVVIKAKMWTSDGKYIKYRSVKNLEQIDDIWVVLESHIVKKQGKRVVHQTFMKQSQVRFNQGLSDRLFTIRRLEKGL
ncbi:MAG: outer membrane lipoprotein-sorting protein [Desulfobacteraceae bacterium]|nr:MAG: outer membrane lipoprotein-sorting protein [Desulfobacteraceae bacterium]